VTFTASRPLPATLRTAPFPPAVDQVRPLIAPGLLRRGALVVGDIVGVVAIVLCIPFVILAIGMPIVLAVRFLLWIAGML
jgi:hypothetical protein